MSTVVPLYCFTEADRYGARTTVGVKHQMGSNLKVIMSYRLFPNYSNDSFDSYRE